MQNWQTSPTVSIIILNKCEWTKHSNKKTHLLRLDIKYQDTTVYKRNVLESETQIGWKQKERNTYTMQIVAVRELENLYKY